MLFLFLFQIQKMIIFLLKEEKRCCTQSWVLKLFPQILHLNLLIRSHHYLVFTYHTCRWSISFYVHFCTSSQAKLQQLCKNDDDDNNKGSITSCCSSLSTMRRVIVSSRWQQDNGSDEHSLFFTIMLYTQISGGGRCSKVPT